MNKLTKKDFAIIGLFFAILLVITPLLGLVDETRFESSLPSAIALLGGIGLLLSMPINVVMAATRTSPEVNLGVVSWLVAIIYSAILAFILFKINARKAKKG